MTDEKNLYIEIPFEKSISFELHQIMQTVQKAPY